VHQPRRRRPGTETKKRLFGVGLDAFVVRPLIVFCNFKYFIDKVKKLFVFKLTFNYIEKYGIPIRFIIAFSFFFVVSPFLIENSFAFLFHSAPNYGHGNILLSKEFSNKFRVIVSGIGETTSFNQMFEGQYGCLKRIEPFPFLLSNVPPNSKYDSTDKENEARNNGDESKDITPAERSEILQIWAKIAQFLSLAITLYIIIRAVL
jgi:hypothetical protein